MTSATKNPPHADDDRPFDPARMRPGRLAGKLVALPLWLLRGAGYKTQADVAAASGIAQGDISKLEKRERLDDVRVGTLRRYVEALGGELELVAKFGERRYGIGRASSVRVLNKKKRRTVKRRRSA